MPEDNGVLFSHAVTDVGAAHSPRPGSRGVQARRRAPSCDPCGPLRHIFVVRCEVVCHGKTDGSEEPEVLSFIMVG